MKLTQISLCHHESPHLICWLWGAKQTSSLIKPTLVSLWKLGLMPSIGLNWGTPPKWPNELILILHCTHTNSYTLMWSCVGWLPRSSPTACSMSGKSDWNKVATSSRLHPLGVQQTLAEIPRSASTSPTVGHPRASRTPPWPSLTSASSSRARERHRHTPSARWRRISTAVWWGSLHKVPSDNVYPFHTVLFTLFFSDGQVGNVGSKAAIFQKHYTVTLGRNL